MTIEEKLYSMNNAGKNSNKKKNNKVRNTGKDSLYNTYIKHW